MREIAIHGKGKVRERSKAAALKKVSEHEEYFIRRNGAWYRPNAAGYTQHILHAGVFTWREARSHLAAEGVSIVSLGSMREELWIEMRDTLERAAKLSALALRN